MHIIYTVKSNANGPDPAKISRSGSATLLYCNKKNGYKSESGSTKIIELEIAKRIKS